MGSVKVKPDCSNKGVPELKQDSHKTAAEFKVLQEVSLAAEGKWGFSALPHLVLSAKSKNTCSLCEPQLPILHLWCFYLWVCSFLLLFIVILCVSVYFLSPPLLFNSLYYFLSFNLCLSLFVYIPMSFLYLTLFNSVIEKPNEANKIIPPSIPL